MKKIKKPVSILLTVLMVFSVFAVVPFTASAAEQMETVNLPVPMPENRTVTTDNITVTGQSAGSNGWELDPDTSATLRLINGKTITKIVIYSASSSNGNPVVKVGGNSISFTKSGDAYTFENINADQVYMEGSTYVFITNKIDVYFSDPTYTVTWKNGDDVLKTDTVDKDAIPAYTGTTPEKAEDAENTYTFSGWSDGTNTYGTAETLPAVTGDVTYTATFTAVPKVFAAQVGSTKYESFSEAVSAWTDNSTLTLLDDVTTSSTISVSGTKTLDLNGYELKMTGNSRVISVNSGASFTLNDVEGNTGKITGGTIDRGAGVRNEGTFIMNGGTITGNTASVHGGGVYTITADSSFIMNGGIITGNTANGVAGGVCVSGPFTMNGGKITNNTSNGTGGGGVYVDSSFVMNGGEISSNNASNNGGGVYVNGGTLTLSGSAVIKNNTKGGSATNNVYLPNNKTINITDALTCDDGSIGITMQNRGVFTNSTNTDCNDPDKFTSDNTTYGVYKKANGQLYIGLPEYTITWKNDDGSVIDTTDVEEGAVPTHADPTKAATEESDYDFAGWTPEIVAATGDAEYTATFTPVAKHVHDGIRYERWTRTNSLPTEAGNYYLGYDVTLSSTWTVSKNIRLCLNGNGITKNGGTVIQVVSGGNLTIDDCGTKTHYFDVNNGKAVNVNTTPGENRNSFTGGYITGGTGQDYDNGYLFWNDGGGIYLDGGNLILNGGTILGNSATFGGGVEIYSGTMTMNGGTVCYNTGSAGISFRTGSSAYNRGGGATTGYFVMNGGLVANNSAGVTTGYTYSYDYATYHGGRIVNNVNYGIYSQNITIDGDIEITGNGNGAGFRDTCSISGNPVITENTNSNLSINNGKTINTGTLGENAKIGIKMSNPGVFTNGYNANNTIDPTEIFTADDPTTFVEKNAAGEVKLGIYVWTASFNAGGGSGTMDPIEVQKERSFNLPECTLTAPEGKLFLNWSDGTNTYNPGDSCTMTADTEFTAQWIDGIKVSFKANGGSGDMEDVLSYPDYKLPACGFTAPEGKFFIGWRSSADNKVYQPGDTVTLTAETQFTAQWGAEVKYQFDFEDGLPDGWQTSNNLWFLNANGGDHNEYNKLTAHSPQKNMTYFNNGSATSELLTSSFDMSNAESATLVFYYTNRDWGGDIDQLVVSYRVGDGAWKQLFATEGNHEGWTEEKITLPSEAFAKNVQFCFHADGNYGWGIALDDVELNITGSKDLIAGHSLSLDGNIGINFYLDPTAAGLTVGQVTKSNLKYSFEWADGNALVDVKAQAEEQEFSIDTKNDVDYIKVTCHVCAAEMTCGVKASFTIGDKTEIETYSVRQYADEILSDSNSSDELKNLTKAMLNYGAKAQTKFRIKSEDPKDLADYKVGYTMGNVTDTMIDEAVKKENGSATDTDLQAVASAHGAKWYTTSLVYLDDNTLRHYFVKDTDDFNPSDYTKNKGNYYYVEVSGIQAKNLDKWQTFKVGNKEFQYSALDFAKLMINSNSDDASKNLAKALYWYNKAANEFFRD